MQRWRCVSRIKPHHPLSPSPPPHTHPPCSHALKKKKSARILMLTKHRLSPSHCSLPPPPPPPIGGTGDPSPPRLTGVPVCFLLSSRPHQPGAEGEVHPPGGSVPGPRRLPLPRPALQAGLPQRLAHALLLLGLPQRRLPHLRALHPGHAHGLHVIQGKSLTS